MGVQDSDKSNESARFHRLPFCIREREMQLLEEAFSSINTSALSVKTPEKRQVVVCQGKSGVGKSRLISEFESRLRKRKAKVYFAHCKFTEFGNQSYGPILRAFDDLLQQALANDMDSGLTANINSSLTPADCAILSSSLPTFRALFEKTLQRASSFVPGMSYDKDKMKTKGYQVPLALLALLRLLASHHNPVVFAFGGLQFAEGSALQIITKLALDPRVQGLMMVYCFREDSTRAVPRALHESIDEMKSENISCIDILVDPMGVEEMRHLLSQILSSDDTSSTDDLASLLHKHTRGDLDMLSHYLHALHANHHLRMDHTSGLFEWNLAEIVHDEAIFNDNFGPLEVLLNDLSHDCREALVIAAYLGIQFDSRLVNYVQRNYGLVNNATNTLAEALEKDVDLLPFEDSDGGCQEIEEAEKLNLVVTYKAPYKYTFANEHVLNAVINLKADCHQPSMCLRIGKLLRAMQQSCQSVSEETILLQLATDQINRGKSLIVDKASLLEAAELNLLAAEVVLKRGMFFPALSYLQMSNGYIDGVGSKWTEYYDLSLRIGTLLVHSAFCCGDFIVCLRLVDEIERNSKCLNDNIEVRQVRIAALTTTSRLVEAVKEAKRLLRDLGLRFRTNTFTMFLSVVKLNILLGSKTDEELVPKKAMTDSFMVEAMETLRGVAFAAYLSGRFDVSTVFEYQMLKLSLKHGANPASATSFANLGIILAVTGDYDGAYRMSKLARMVVAAWSPQSRSPLVEYTSQLLLEHWKLPLQQGTDELLLCYQQAMKEGDPYTAFWNIVTYTNKYWFSGWDLVPLSRDVRQYTVLMRAYGQKLLLGVVLPYFQAGANLMSDDSKRDPLVLEGEFIPCLSAFLVDCKDKNEILATGGVRICELMLGYFFDDLESAHEAGEYFSIGKNLQGQGAHAGVYNMVFFRGLVCFGLARKNTRRSRVAYFKRRGRKHMKQMETWTKGGAVNCFHMMKLLQAEMLSFKVSTADISTAYSNAISSAGRGGFLHHQAIASLRKGLWHHRQSDREDAVHLMNQACELFHEWGARAIVRHILRTYNFVSCGSMVASAESKIEASGALRSVQRYDATIAERHRTVV